jgi:hypothetical protein
MRLFLRSIFVVLAAALFGSTFLTHSSAQLAGKTFSHLTKSHQYADCKICHTLPSRNWMSPRADKSDPFPDVTDYPFNVPDTRGSAKHTACFGCHTKDIYLNGGIFCAGCHIAAGPRARPGSGLRPFPNKAHGTQFVTIFPHDVHQDVIASKDSRHDVAIGHFAFARFTAPPANRKPEFYNCSVCHQTPNSLPKYAARKPISDQKPLPAAADNFKPTAEYFKNVPMNHASCFSCHYQRIQPVSTNCAGCHKLADKPYFPSDVVERYTLKFSHEQLGKRSQVGERVHAKDCMTCHVRTAGSSDLQALKNKKEPEVPFSTCVSCHSDDIKDQLEKREKDKTFQCAYCHTPAIGRYEKPESHHE